MNKLKELKLSQVTPVQVAYAFHKFIHNQRGTDSWNALDEFAFQAIKSGLFEWKNKEGKK